MAGKYRIDRVCDEATENAQCKIPQSLYDAVVKRAASEGVSASYYWRKWIYTGFKKDFKELK